MRRIVGRPRIGLGSAVLALFLILMPTTDARAQFLGYGYGYPGWGYGGWGYGGFGYGYPVAGFVGGAAYTYPGLAFPVVVGYPAYGIGGYGGLGWGYPAYGYGGLGYGAYGYMSGGIGMSGVGFLNPMFGVGLTPLGTQSYLYETRMLGRVPRVSTGYEGAYGGRYGGTTSYRGR